MTKSMTYWFLNIKRLQIQESVERGIYIAGLSDEIVGIPTGPQTYGVWRIASSLEDDMMESY